MPAKKAVGRSAPNANQISCFEPQSNSLKEVKGQGSGSRRRASASNASSRCLRTFVVPPSGSIFSSSSKSTACPSPAACPPALSPRRESPFRRGHAPTRHCQPRRAGAVIPDDRRRIVGEDPRLRNDLGLDVEGGEELAHRLDVAGVAVEVAHAVTRLRQPAGAAPQVQPAACPSHRPRSMVRPVMVGGRSGGAPDERSGR